MTDDIREVGVSRERSEGPRVAVEVATDPDPVGHCVECDGWHRLGQGCVRSEIGGMRLVVLMLGLAMCLVGLAIGMCVGALLR